MQKKNNGTHKIIEIKQLYANAIDLANKNRYILNSPLRGKFKLENQQCTLRYLYRLCAYEWSGLIVASRGNTQFS